MAQEVDLAEKVALAGKLSNLEVDGTRARVQQGTGLSRGVGLEAEL